MNNGKYDRGWKKEKKNNNNNTKLNVRTCWNNEFSRQIHIIPPHSTLFFLFLIYSCRSLASSLSTTTTTKRKKKNHVQRKYTHTDKIPEKITDKWTEGRDVAELCICILWNRNKVPFESVEYHLKEHNKKCTAHETTFIHFFFVFIHINSCFAIFLLFFSHCYIQNYLTVARPLRHSYKSRLLFPLFF